MGESEHSYGHGQFCYWCGLDGDVDDDKPCDESVNKRPTAAEVAAYSRLCTLAEDICEIADELRNGEEDDVDDIVQRIVERVSEHKGEGKP